MSNEAYRADRPPLLRGGANNSASRTSLSLRHDIAVTIIQAAYCAYLHKVELNRFITIHWQNSGLIDAEAAKATGRFIKLFGDWMARNGFPRVWLWVRENDGAIGRVGSHVHILLHVPNELAGKFKTLPSRWMKKIIGRKPVKKTVRSLRVRGHTSIAISADTYLTNLYRHVAYMLKAVPTAYARRLGLQQAGVCGEVIGKRAAVCQYLRVQISEHSELCSSLSESDRLQRSCPISEAAAACHECDATLARSALPTKCRLVKAWLKFIQWMRLWLGRQR